MDGTVDQGVQTVFVSPHLDDVCLSCGGQVARSVGEGCLVKILTVFAGIPAASYRLSPLAQTINRFTFGRETSAPDAIQIRRSEDAASSAILGASSIFLSYADAIYRQPERTLQQLFGPIRPKEGRLVELIAAELNAMSGATFFFPLGSGGHVDHQICAAAGWKLHGCGRQVAFYEDFPYIMTGQPSQYAATMGRS
jgi:LmbE family N-acetylglucosaminyl deacetylase